MTRDVTREPDSLPRQLAEAIEKDFGAQGERLWLKYPNYQVFRHPGSGKWFAVMMDVSRAALGYGDDRGADGQRWSAGDGRGADGQRRSAGDDRGAGLRAEEETVWVLVVKCDPLMRDALLTEPGFLPAYHMNKRLWISALLDGSLPLRRIMPLLDMSYAMTAPRRGKARS